MAWLLANLSVSRTPFDINLWCARHARPARWVGLGDCLRQTGYQPTWAKLSAAQSFLKSQARRAGPPESLALQPRREEEGSKAHSQANQLPSQWAWSQWARWRLCVIRPLGSWTFWEGVQQAAKFNAIGRHTVTLHKRSHLLTDRTPRTQLWQCSTSLFSLTCFYELSNQAFINSTCLLFGIPLPHAIYLKARQPTYAQCDIWGDALLNKSTVIQHMQLRHVRQHTHYSPRN